MRQPKLLMILISFIAVACSTKPKVPETEMHYLSGNELVLKEDFDNAIKEYELAIKADSTNWKACYQVAGIYELKGDMKNAYAYFTQALTINPKFSLGYFNRSNMEELMGSDKASMKDLKAVLKTKPFYMAYLTMGEKENRVGHYREAVAAFDSAVMLNPDFYAAYSMRGMARYKSGDLNGAIHDFDLEIQMAPDHLMGYVNRAVAYGEQKNYRAAIADLSTVLNLDPMWSQAYIYRGMYYYQLGVKDSACGDFRVAYKMKNPQAEAYSKQYCK